MREPRPRREPSIAVLGAAVASTLAWGAMSPGEQPWHHISDGNSPPLPAHSPPQSTRL